MASNGGSIDAALLHCLMVFSEIIGSNLLLKLRGKKMIEEMQLRLFSYLQSIVPLLQLSFVGSMLMKNRYFCL